MLKSRKRLVSCILAVLLISVWITAGMAADTYYVQSKEVDVKAGRGDFQPVIYKAKLGEAFEILEQKDSWYKVRTPKGDGWVSEQDVSTKNPGSTQ